MKKFYTVDATRHKHSFYFALHQHPAEPAQFEFRVFSLHPNPERWFSAVFRKMKWYALNESLNNNGFGEFSMMGIPEQIIEIASRELNCTIRSFPITGKPATFLTGAAYQVWERLCEKNKNAGFDTALNCFVLEKKDR